MKRYLNEMTSPYFGRPQRDLKLMAIISIPGRVSGAIFSRPWRDKSCGTNRISPDRSIARSSDKIIRPILAGLLLN